MNITLGSLFDGSGGFPLAGALCGIEPVWASEIEPYPIAVTKSRFPEMKHLGDISKIDGAAIEPVDVITFGSPCQDLSVAGKRAGLKHEANGDGETTRSGLFMEAIRIIKEMRCATNGNYPRFALWENVPGAFSSNKGEDFRIVLEELIKIIEEKASVPPTPKGGWPYADAYVGDGWSLAYRTFDAQYWGMSVIDPCGKMVKRGTPQRRRRIYLVADLAGGCAPRILFEREGLRGYIEAGKRAWERTTADPERGVGADDTTGDIIIGSQPAGEGKDPQQYLFENHWLDGRYSGPLDTCPTLTKMFGTGGNNVPYVLKSQENETVCGLDGYNSTLTGDRSSTLGVNCGMSTGRNGVLVSAGFKAGQGIKAGGLGWQAEIVPTLTGVPSGTNQVPAVCAAFTKSQRNELRDLKCVSGSHTTNRGMKQQTYITEKLVLDDQGGQQITVRTDGKAPTLRAEVHGNIPCVLDTPESTGEGANACSLHCMANGQVHAEITNDISSTLNCAHEQQIVFEGYQFGNYREGCGSLRASGGDYGGGSENLVVEPKNIVYIVRRLTPIECARLQGFPDYWGYP